MNLRQHKRRAVAGMKRRFKRAAWIRRMKAGELCVGWQRYALDSGAIVWARWALPRQGMRR